MTDNWEEKAESVYAELPVEYFGSTRDRIISLIALALKEAYLKGKGTRVRADDEMLADLWAKYWEPSRDQYGDQLAYAYARKTYKGVPESSATDEEIAMRFMRYVHGYTEGVSQ